MTILIPANTDVTLLDGLPVRSGDAMRILFREVQSPEGLWPSDIPIPLERAAGLDTRFSGEQNPPQGIASPRPLRLDAFGRIRRDA